MGVKMADFAKAAIKPIRGPKVELPGPKPAWLGKEPRIGGAGKISWAVKKGVK